MLKLGLDILLLKHKFGKNCIEPGFIKVKLNDLTKVKLNDLTKVKLSDLKVYLGYGSV